MATRTLLRAPAHTARTHARLNRRKITNRTLLYLGVAVYIIIAVFPIYWMILTAFKSNADLYNPRNFRLWFNLAPTFTHVAYLFQKTNFTTWLVNTYIISFFTVIITLLAAVPAGYALGRMRLPGGDTLAIAI